MRKVLLALAASLGLLFSVAPAAMASPAHAAKAQTSCSARLKWAAGDTVYGSGGGTQYVLGFNPANEVVVMSNTSSYVVDWCQLYNSSTGLFEYQDPSTGNCMTWNNGGSGITGGWLDEVSCNWYASQSWSAVATDPYYCSENGNRCYYLQGNLYVANNNSGNGGALQDEGLNNSPQMETANSSLYTSPADTSDGSLGGSQTWFNFAG